MFPPHDCDLDSGMHVFESNQFEVRLSLNARMNTWINLDMSFRFLLLKCKVSQIILVLVSSKLSRHRILVDSRLYAIPRSCSRGIWKLSFNPCIGVSDRFFWVDAGEGVFHCKILGCWLGKHRCYLLLDGQLLLCLRISSLWLCLLRILGRKRLWIRCYCSSERSRGISHSLHRQMLGPIESNV